MRGWPILIALGLAACVSEPPPVVFVGMTEWRTSTGHLVTNAELAALRQSCEPRSLALPFDPDRPVQGAGRDSPTYRPGGEGLANAPLLGLAVAGNPVLPPIVRGREIRLEPADECLERKGLVRSP